jgi:hypothetical protein
MEDWPFGLEELEPHYDKVEYELGVAESGEHQWGDRPAR